VHNTAVLKPFLIEGGSGMTTSSDIEEVAAASTASSRRSKQVALIVFHEDPRPPDERIAAYTAPGARSAPHYHVAAGGAVTRLAPEERAARHSGPARWNGRRRDIDQISVGVVLEHTPGAPFSAGQLPAAYGLANDIAERYELSQDALMLWAASPEDGPRAGQLVPFALPADPVVPAEDEGPIEIIYDDEPGDPVLVLGEEAAPARDLWSDLQQASFRPRGGQFFADWASHKLADQLDLGAPLSAPIDPGSGIKIDGRLNGFQIFARDTLFWDAERPTEVRRMSDVAGSPIPASGAGFEVLKATYAAMGAALEPGKSFPERAACDKLGPPLANPYIQKIAGQDYFLQVFALDTIFVPFVGGDTRWRRVRLLEVEQAYRDAGVLDTIGERI
jgi:hypothetical protein